MINLRILVSISKQQLQLFDGAKLLALFPVSTALNGPGEQEGSGCTPRGRHVVRALIGKGLPVNAVFVGRRFTGEVYSPQLACQYPSRDWILSRILWLSGREVGFNRLGDVDTMRRYIYIHGTPDSEPMGVARSHGCIRMRNKDLIELYDQVLPGTEVLIEE